MSALTDRELLELAAKAAGLTIEWDARGAYIVEEGVSGATHAWSPLTDDGDALRLAVKLELCVSMEPGWLSAITDDGVEYVEDYSGDPYAATRRAIVRAAAATGQKGE